MTQAEDLINKELKKKRRAIEHIEEELVFIEKWLGEGIKDQEEKIMGGYLRGRRAGLREVLGILQ